MGKAGSISRIGPYYYYLIYHSVPFSLTKTGTYILFFPSKLRIGVIKL